MLIRAVLFDLYETLVTEVNQPLRRASSLATQLGVDEPAYKREWKSRRADIVLGRCTFHDALAQIAAKLGGVLGVVTNAFAEDVVGWNHSPLRPLFDLTVFSYAAGLAASRALWFAANWPATTIRHDDPGLWRIGQVVDAARAG